MKHIKRLAASAALTIVTSGISACGGGSGGSAANTPVVLRFQAVDDSTPVTCESRIARTGQDGQNTVGISDLRFYVSNIRLFDEAGRQLRSELVANEFQLLDPAGDVALVDLTGNVAGSCTSSAIAFNEGTARVNESVQLMAEEGKIARVAFDVGVPQALMKKVVSTYTAEDAPSPLGELYWSWASGYRHFVLNFTVLDKNGTPGEGYLHLGSRDCGGDGAIALTDRESCGFVNTPAVDLAGFDPETNTVAVDVRNALNGLRMVTELYDVNPPYAPIGSGPGAACHSAPPESQPDCSPVFANFGLDPATGASSASANSVFSVQ